jgi:S-adenosylmethionine:tRNA ribosyltransferase-isomerase
VIDNTTSRGRTVRFNVQGDFFKIIDRIGKMPLPYYIKREPTDRDKETYQTVFARAVGAVAAPTAGLHFTKRLLASLKRKGVKVVPVVLHVGLGSFRAVEVEDLTKHKMDSEYYEIPDSTAAGREDHRHAGERVRLRHEHVPGPRIERHDGRSPEEQQGWTDKFIFPPYDFKITDRLITNFHMPESTLLMLAAAFSGRDLLMKSYKKSHEGRVPFLQLRRCDAPRVGRHVFAEIPPPPGGTITGGSRA